MLNHNILYSVGYTGNIIFSLSVHINKHTYPKWSNKNLLLFRQNKTYCQEKVNDCADIFGHV